MTDTARQLSGGASGDHAPRREAAGEPRWELLVARPDSWGGRACRRQLTRERLAYKCWGGEHLPGAARRGLLLPALEGRAALAEVQQLLRAARAEGFARAVLLCPAPEPGLLALCAAAAGEGLSCVAVCAEDGTLFGRERPEDGTGVPEELLDELARAAGLGKKRAELPRRETAELRLTYADDLAGAALFALRGDGGIRPLLVPGVPCTDGALAQAAAQAVHFGGRLRFGRKVSRHKAAVPAGFREMRADAARLPLTKVLDSLARSRARGGRLRLSACVIMRDNEEDIGSCLASLAAADEIIVVDTGSVDRSMEIARKYTDKLFHFEWIDDFAAAKNFALDQASGDWIVFPDSDERFTAETAPGLKALCEDADGIGAEMLSVRHRNVTLSGEYMDTEGACTRLWRRGLRWEGAIHETIGEGARVLAVPRERALMLHTGYAPERLEGKASRNRRILARLEAEGRPLSNQGYYRARDAFRQGEWEEARRLARQEIERGGEESTMRFELYRWWYKSSLALEDAAGAEEAREAMRRDMPSMPDSWAIEGAELWNEGRKTEAEPLLKKALELTRDFLQLNPGEIDQIGRDSRGIAAELASYCEQEGRRAEAEAYRCLANEIFGS
ncbi:MAG: glycosyltransferase family 2 protein [Desulfovibrio sp.]|nr:glycosyltransferase family 2 protein [Desulfovibrio sp.]